MENQQKNKANYPHKQKTLLNEWAAELIKIDAIDAVWVEGSITDPTRLNPGSDIDIRFAIKDSEFDRLWDSERETIYAPLGETYQMTPFRRATRSGILIESEAYKTSQLSQVKAYNYEFLFQRNLEAIAPIVLEKTPVSHKWPSQIPKTAEIVTKYGNELLRSICIASTPFFKDNCASALLELEIGRANLMQLMYWRNGVTAFARSKHLNQVFSQQEIEDYLYTQLRGDENPLDFASVAAATIRCFEMQIKHLELIYAQIDIIEQFPRQWIETLFQTLKDNLAPILSQAPTQA